MKFWIVTDNERILIVHHVPTEGAIEVEADEDLVRCGDTYEKYRYIDGQVTAI